VESVLNHEFYMAEDLPNFYNVVPRGIVMSDRLKVLAKIVIGLTFIQVTGYAARKAVFLCIDRTLLSDTVVQQRYCQ